MSQNSNNYYDPALTGDVVSLPTVAYLRGKNFFFPAYIFKQDENIVRYQRFPHNDITAKPRGSIFALRVGEEGTQILLPTEKFLALNHAGKDISLNISAIYIGEVLENTSSVSDFVNSVYGGTESYEAQTFLHTIRCLSWYTHLVETTDKGWLTDTSLMQVAAHLVSKELNEPKKESIEKETFFSGLIKRVKKVFN